MGYVPKGAPKGKKTKERFNTVEADIFAAPDGGDVFITTQSGSSFQVESEAGGTLMEITDAGVTSILEVDTDNINKDDDAVLEVGGFVSTRNAADNSMYVPVAASLAHERLWKVAGKVTANDGGYFDALYVNAATTATATGGEIRAVEAKTTINADMSAGAIGTGVYAKVTVADASEVAQAIGVDVLLEESGSGAITSGVGVRVQGGAGAIDYAIDAGGLYRKGALKVPAVGGAAIGPANLATAFGITENAAAGDDAIVGFYTDSADSNAISLVVKVGGLYKYVKLTDAS